MFLLAHSCSGRCSSPAQDEDGQPSKRSRGRDADASLENSAWSDEDVDSASNVSERSSGGSDDSAAQRAVLEAAQDCRRWDPRYQLSIVPTNAAGFKRQTVSDRQVWVKHTIVGGQPDSVRELLSDVVEGLRDGTASKQALTLLGLREIWGRFEKHGFVDARSFVEQLLPHLGSRGGLSEDGVLEPCFSCFVSSHSD